MKKRNVLYSFVLILLSVVLVKVFVVLGKVDRSFMCNKKSGVCSLSIGANTIGTVGVKSRPFSVSIDGGL